ncbi:MAG: hypothetical protein BJ554DRAFT_7944, partial [Olpidium bornovanus]
MPTIVAQKQRIVTFAEDGPPSHRPAGPPSPPQLQRAARAVGAFLRRIGKPVVAPDARRRCHKAQPPPTGEAPASNGGMAVEVYVSPPSTTNAEAAAANIVSFRHDSAKSLNVPPQPPRKQHGAGDAAAAAAAEAGAEGEAGRAEEAEAAAAAEKQEEKEKEEDAVEGRERAAEIAWSFSAESLELDPRRSASSPRRKNTRSAPGRPSAAERLSSRRSLSQQSLKTMLGQPLPCPGTPERPHPDDPSSSAAPAREEERKDGQAGGGGGDESAEDGVGVESRSELPLGACLFSRSLGEADAVPAEGKKTRLSDMVKGLNLSAPAVKLLDEHYPETLLPSVIRSGEFTVDKLVSVTWCYNANATTVTVVYDPPTRKRWKWKGAGDSDEFWRTSGMIVSTVWSGEWNAGPVAGGK